MSERLLLPYYGAGVVEEIAGQHDQQLEMWESFIKPDTYGSEIGMPALTREAAYADLQEALVQKMYEHKRIRKVRIRSFRLHQPRPGSDVPSAKRYDFYRHVFDTWAEQPIAHDISIERFGRTDTYSRITISLICISTVLIILSGAFVFSTESSSGMPSIAATLTIGIGALSGYLGFLTAEREHQVIEVLSGVD